MSARYARRMERRQMPLRQLALWMKMVRPLALSRGPSGRRLPGTLQRQPRPNAPRERPKPERVARLPSVAGQERAADVTLASLLLWHGGPADRNACAGCRPCSPSGAYIRCSCAVIAGTPRGLPRGSLPRGKLPYASPHNIPIYVTGEGIPRARGGVARISVK